MGKVRRAVGSAALVVGVVAVSGCQPIQPWRHTVGSGDSTGTVGGNGFSSEPTFSPDGAALAFVNTSSDLGPADEGDDPDVYVRDLAAGTNTLVSVNADGNDAGNDGPDPAGGASVALLLPEQATFVDADSPCTPPTAEQPRLVTCPLGTVAPAARPTVGIRADVAAPGGSTITAVAAVSSPTVDPAPRNNTATSAVLVP